MMDLMFIVRSYLFQKLGLDEEFDDLLRVHEIPGHSGMDHGLEIRFLDIRFIIWPRYITRSLGKEYEVELDYIIREMSHEWLPLLHMRMRQIAVLAEAIDKLR